MEINVLSFPTFRKAKEQFVAWKDWSFNDQHGLRTIQYIYFIRFPLLTYCTILFVWLLSIKISPEIFRNLLAMNSWYELFIAAWFVFQAVFSVMVIIRLILFYGPERFRIAVPFRVYEQMSWRQFMAWTLAAMPLIASIITTTTVQQSVTDGSYLIHLFKNLASTLLGYCMAVFVLFIAAILQRFSAPPNSIAKDFLFPNNKLLIKAHEKQFTPPDFITKVNLLVGTLPKDLRAGFWDIKNQRIHQGQYLAFAFFTLQVLLYFAGWFFQNPENNVYQLPAIAYLMFLITFLSTLTSSLSFFFDRFQVSALTAPVLVILLISLIADSDHYYQIQPKTFARTTMHTNPQTVLDSWHKRNPKANTPMVIVTTSGGGIQAAAWTAKVLTSLQSECHGEFSPKIALISSVSGGSVGTAHFVQGLYPKNTNDTQELENIVLNSEKSGINQIGWGLIYPDTMHAIFPLAAIKNDRGWALEKAWEQSGLKDQSLGDWEEDLLRGTKPGVIMNATIAESGDPFPFANFDIGQISGVRNFHSIYPNSDISVITAARMSATFPFATPMAQADPNLNESSVVLHIGDGGYYDDYGVISALFWLEDVLNSDEDGKKLPQKILLLQIRAFPNEAPNPMPTRRSTASGLRMAITSSLADAIGLKAREYQSWPWYQQILGPITTLINVRDSAQPTRNNFEVNMLLKSNITKEKTITTFVFQPQIDHFHDPMETPLSWQLTPLQKSNIEQEWKYQKRDLENLKKELGCR